MDTIKEYKALLQLAEEAGYEYTTADDDYNEFIDTITSTAESNSMTVKAYIKSLYGDNASLSNIKSYILDVLEAQSYLEVLQEELAATDEEVAAYIEENYSSEDTESSDSTESTESTDSTEDSSTDYDEDEIKATILSEKYNDVISPVMDAMSVTNIHNRIKMYSSSSSSSSTDSEDSDTSDDTTEEAGE